MQVMNWLSNFYSECYLKLQKCKAVCYKSIPALTKNSTPRYLEKEKWKQMPTQDLNWIFIVAFYSQWPPTGNSLKFIHMDKWNTTHQLKGIY